MSEVIFVRVRDSGMLRNAIASSGAGSLRAVASEAGTVSHSFVASLASGRLSRVRLGDAERIAAALGWEVSDLFEVEGLARLQELGMV